MGSRDAFNQALEQLVDHGLQLRDVADLQHLQHLGQEHDLLGGAGEGPVSEQAFDELKGKKEKSIVKCR